MKNKIVIITGAGSGIGRALAIEFGRLGSQLALNDYNQSELNETVSLLNKEGVEPLTAIFDVSQKEAMWEFAKTVKSKLGNANIVINNAGISGDDLPGYLIKEETYRKVMDINFFGVLNGCQAFLPQLVENNSGTILNVSSTFGLIGATNCSDYCASKYAVRGYTESLQAEFVNSPIVISCLHPGGIKTRINRNANTVEFDAKYLKTPPQDIAKHVIKSIQKKKVKIVYGSDSMRLWFMSSFQ